MRFYRDTLKQAWKLTSRNPWLWFFGLFAALSANGDEYDTFFNNLSFVRRIQLNLDAYRGALFNGEIGDFFRNFSRAFGQDALAIGLVLLVALIIGLLVIWLITVSQAALIKSASQNRDNQPIGWVDVIHAGTKVFWKVLGLNVIAKAIIYVPLAGLGLPLVLLYLQNEVTAWSVIMTLVGFLILVPASIVVSFITKYATAYIVIQGAPVKKAIPEGWRLFVKNWLITIELALLLFIINFIVGFIAVSLMTTLGLTATTTGLSVFTIVIISLGSILAVFQFSAWTFLFRDLIEDRGVSKLVRIFHPNFAKELE